MFSSRHSTGSGGSANRWLIVAGAGLVILAFVARMLMDIGHTKVSDLTGALRPDSATPAAADSAPAVASPDTAAAPLPSPPESSVSTSPASANAPAAAPASPPPPPVSAAVRSDTPPAPKTPAGVSVIKNPRPPILLPDTTQWKGASLPAGRGYAVQIGAFGSRGNADKLAARAASLGFGAGVSSETRSGGTLYLVRVTGLTGPDEARTAADSLTRSLKVNAVVIPPGH